MKPLLISSIFAILASTANADNRINSLLFDRSKATPVKMRPGLATVLMFPCPIEEAIAGNNADVSVVISDFNLKQATISLNSSVSQVTNLIVRCQNQDDLFVFDLVPRTFEHQDVVKISGAYGGPELNRGSLKLVESSQSPTHSKDKLVLKQPKLIKDSK